MAASLELIVEMTETAANKTMDLAEKMSGELKKRTKLDKEALMRIDALTAGGELSAQAADTLEPLRAVLQARDDSDAHIQSILTEMSIAQDYQGRPFLLELGAETMRGTVEYTHGLSNFHKRKFGNWVLAEDTAQLTIRFHHELSGPHMSLREICLAPAE